MKYVDAVGRETIQLGRQGENDATVVRFPISGWEQTYGHGSYEVLHQRCMDTVPYLVPITVDDEYVNWTVQSADVAYVGRGRAELVYTVNGIIAKSVVYNTTTLKSIDGAGVYPPAYESRINDLIEAAGTIDGTVEQAEAARDAAIVAQEAAEDAQEDAETAQSLAEDARDEALDAQSAAEAAVSDAEQHSGDAAGYAQLSESWAVGGTGTRQGEDVNNSKFWAEMAQQQAEASGYIFANVNEQTGRLEITVVGDLADDFDASINQSNGHLEVRIRYGE